MDWVSLRGICVSLYLYCIDTHIYIGVYIYIYTSIKLFSPSLFELLRFLASLQALYRLNVHSNGMCLK